MVHLFPILVAARHLTTYLFNKKPNQMKMMHVEVKPDSPNITHHALDQIINIYSLFSRLQFNYHCSGRCLCTKPTPCNVQANQVANHQTQNREKEARFINSWFHSSPTSSITSSNRHMSISLYQQAMGRWLASQLLLYFMTFTSHVYKRLH